MLFGFKKALMIRLIVSLCMCVTPAIAEEITVSDISSFFKTDVFFLGELHDNPYHHERQAEAVALIEPSAIVFEMLTAAQSSTITPALREDPRALRAALDWDNSGWPDFDMYYPIIKAAPYAEIYGAQVTRDAARALIKTGDITASFGPDAEIFGLTSALPKEQQTLREDAQFAAHCDALPKEMLAPMVLVQRMRDASLAKAAMDAFFETGGPVVVITGNGHARTDWGAPALMDSVLHTVSIAQLESRPDGDINHDHYILSPEAMREDPCLAFKKN